MSVHLFIRPVLVGESKPALPGGTRFDLELPDDRRLNDSVVYVRYRIPISASTLQIDGSALVMRGHRKQPNTPPVRSTDRSRENRTCDAWGCPRTSGMITGRRVRDRRFPEGVG
jgi:hypothetical protein